MRVALELALAVLSALTAAASTGPDAAYDCEAAGSRISSSITSSGFIVELDDGAAAAMAKSVPGGASGETYQNRLDWVTSTVRTYLRQLSDDSDLPFTDMISAVPLRCTTDNTGDVNWQYDHACGCHGTIYSLRCDQVSARDLPSTHRRRSGLP